MYSIVRRTAPDFRATARRTIAHSKRRSGLAHRRRHTGPGTELAAGPAGEFLALALPPAVLVLVVMKAEDDRHHHERGHADVHPGPGQRGDECAHAGSNDRRDG